MSEEGLPPTVRIPPNGAAFEDGVEPAEGAPDGGRSKEWVVGLVAFIVFMAMLVCAGQLAVLAPHNFGNADTRSRIKPDYSLWPYQVIPAVNPAILEVISQGTPLPTEIRVVSVFETLQLPTVPSPTPSVTASPRPSRTPRPTIAIVIDTPVRAPTTAAPTPTLRATRPRPTAPNIQPTGSGPIATRTPTRVTPTRTETRRPSQTPTRTPTLTRTLPVTPNTPTNTPHTSTATRPPRTPTRTPRPTNTPVTPTRTNTPVTPSATPITPSATPETPTLTGTFFVIDTDTPGPTSSPTATLTPVAPGLNEGTPDGNVLHIPCGTSGSSVTIDFGPAGRLVHSFVFYEEYNYADCQGICLDWFQIFVSNSDRIDTLAIRVFAWGDNNPDNNGNIFASHLRSTPPSERDNEPIPSDELFPSTATDPSKKVGVCISIPEDTYRYIYLFAPPNCADDAQIDAFEVNVTPEWCPTPP